MFPFDSVSHFGLPDHYRPRSPFERGFTNDLNGFGRTPNLSKSFPLSIPDIKISEHKPDVNHVHHFDVLKAIQGGTDQFRIDPKTGTILGGSTNIGKIKMPWDIK